MFSDNYFPFKDSKEEVPLNTVGKRIKYLRKINKESQGSAAKKIGISQGTLSDIENDKTKPSIDTIISVSRYFSISADWLLTGENDEKLYNEYHVAENQKDVDNYFTAPVGDENGEMVQSVEPDPHFASKASLKGAIRDSINDFYKKLSNGDYSKKDDIVREINSITNKIEGCFKTKFVIQDTQKQQPEANSKIESYISKVLGDISEDEVNLIYLYRQLTEKDKGKAEYFVERIIEDYSRDCSKYKGGGSSIFSNGEETAAKDVG